MRKRILFAIVIFSLAIVISSMLIFREEGKPISVEKDLTEKGISKELLSTPSAKVDQQVILPTQKVLTKKYLHIYQTFNNCGPATLSMISGFYGVEKSQKEIGEIMRPYQNPKGDNDDKTIFPYEFAQFARDQGFEAKTGPAATIEFLKEVIARGEIPVVVKGWLRKNEDIGHFWIVKGYDEREKALITTDSYHAPFRKTSYFDFLQLWQPFNYGYILVYPSQKKAVVEPILAKLGTENAQYTHARQIAEEENQLDPKNIYPIFNLSTSFYHLGEFQKSVEAFEKVEQRLPRRMLWYQIEPILAYKELGRYDRVFQITQRVLDGGNRAFSELYQIRGEVFLAQGQRERAKEEFEKALFYNKNYQPAKEALGKF
jgi:tetratricopeptide (TPR) repeat protein